MINTNHQLEGELYSKLEAAEARVHQLRAAIAAGPCREYGHDWQFIGGSNAGCGADCGCSVPVYECQKCGGCDYGDNPESAEIREKCWFFDSEETCRPD